MNTQEKIEYAKLRQQGASLFEGDEQESNKWSEAVAELEKQLQIEIEADISNHSNRWNTNNLDN